MSFSRRSLVLALAAGSVPLFLALSLPALHGAPVRSARGAANAETPQQVAETLDSIVQPRFQQNAGLFGPDRVMVPTAVLDGHDNVSWVNPNNVSEKRLFNQVIASHRSYILAFLHCRHKPGAHTHPPKPAEPLDSDFQPSTDALIAVGATEAGTERTFDWANKVLNPVVLPHLKQLKQGRPAQTEYENWVIVMRPVRATHQACLYCHTGTKRGDTLGVMVYAVDKNAKIKGKSFNWSGGGE